MMQFDHQTDNTLRDGSTLTGLERKCLEYAAHGQRPEDIGRLTRTSPKEVEILLYSAQRKLGASTLLHAIALHVGKELAGKE